VTAAAVALNGFGFRPAGRRRWAVRDVDLRVSVGEKVLLIGASGSGKSTVLRAVAGLLDAGGEMAGSVEVNGHPSASSQGRVGLLLQDPDAGLVLTRAGEDVAFGPQNQGLAPEHVERRVSQALASVGFTYGREHPVAALSGGERQRLALAGVLAMRPDVLLLDEPTSMLDHDGARLVREAVERAVSDTACTVIVVEHNTQMWRDLVDRVVVLDSEGVVADGTPQAVSQSSAAADTWLVQPASETPAVRSPGERLIVAADVSFRHKGQERLALSDVDVDLRSGSTVAVVGDNGSGKTTLARLLGGLEAPTSGAVTATQALRRDDRLDAAPHRWRAAALAGRIGSVFQNPEHAFLAAEVREELAIGPRALGQSEARVASTVDDLLVRLRLLQVADQNPFTLSGGEQRRLSVGAAIATSPRVLILDEPTFGQDPTTWRELARMTLELCERGAAISVATHDRRFCDTVADNSLRLVASENVA
jgi:energy-coupling factor transport system ATP-binding protein